MSVGSNLEQCQHVWWLMEWVCRRLWALYPPNMKFLYYPHVDPVEVAMALNPSRMPHWGRFVTFSLWLQGYSIHTV